MCLRVDIFNFEVKWVNFCFKVCALLCPTKSLPNPRSQDFLLLSFRNFIVSLTFTGLLSSLHVIWGKGWEVLFFFLSVDVHLSQFHLLKRHFFPFSHFEITSTENHLTICVEICGLFIGIYLLCHFYWAVDRNYSIWFFLIDIFLFSKICYIGNWIKRGNCFLWSCEERPVAKECHFEFIEQSAFQWLEMLLLPNLYLSIMENKWQYFCIGNEEVGSKVSTYLLWNIDSAVDVGFLSLELVCVSDGHCLSRCLSACCAALSLVLGF